MRTLKVQDAADRVHDEVHRGESELLAWICALPHELTASRAMFDTVYEPPRLRQDGDDNVYTFGEVAGHKVVMTCLPAGKYGPVSAALVAKDLKRSFPSVQHGLMVGIGGGIPTIDHHIQLGDVVVSKPAKDHGGVIQYDIGKALKDGRFERRGHLNEPPRHMLSAVAKLQAMQEVEPPRIEKFLEQAFRKFPNLRAKYSRPIDNEQAHVTPRPRERPIVHYGLIASGSKVIASKEV